MNSIKFGQCDVNNYYCVNDIFLRKTIDFGKHTVLNLSCLGKNITLSFSAVQNLPILITR